MRTRLLLATLFMFTATFAQQVDTSFWVTNGPVYALQQYNNKLYIGGSFDQVSPCTGFFVQSDSTNGNVLPWPKVNGDVYVTLKDDSGGFFVGGNFTRVGNLSISNLFHMDSLGVIDLNFQPNPDGAVRAISKVGRKVYFCGDFTSVFSEPRGRAASVFMPNDSLTPWNPQFDNTVYAIAFDTLYGKMIIGGSFLHADGFVRNHIGKFDTLDGHVWQWPIQITEWVLAPIDGPVRAIQIDHLRKKVYIGGDFTTVESQYHPGVAELKLKTGVLMNYTPNVLGSVYDLRLVKNKLYIAGAFGTVGGNTRANLACVDTALAAGLLPWNPSANGRVCRLIPDSGKWYVCGDFKILNGQQRYKVAVMDTSMSYTVETYAPMVNGTVWTVLRFMGKLWMGGSFTGIGGLSCKNLCRIDITSGIADPWVPDVSQAVRTLVLHGNILFMAGDFSIVDAAQRNRICAFDLTNDQLLPFNPGCDGLVRCFAFLSDTVFMGGNFTTVAGNPRANLAAVKYPSGAIANWNPSPQGTVNAIATSAHEVIIAGYFSQVSNVTRNNLARIHALTGIADVGWDPDVDDGVYQLVPYGGDYYMAGWFNQVSGQPHSFLCSINTASGVPGSFWGQTDDFVRLLHLSNNTLFAAGNFGLVQNVQSFGFSAYDLSNGTFRPFNPHFEGSPFAMTSTTNRLFVGGSYNIVNTTVQSNLAALDITAVTGIAAEENGADAALVAYPNPASDELWIECGSPVSADDPAIITLTDLSGRELLRMENVREHRLRLQLPELAAGLYMVSWQTRTAVRNAKFSKQ